MKVIFASIIVVFAVASVLLSARALNTSEKIICGTNSGDEIYCTNYSGMEQGRWERIPGSLKQVVVLDGHLWGVNHSDQIYYTESISTPHWILIQGSAKEISAGRGTLCVVNETNDIYCADKGITTPQPEWHKAPGGASLKYISIN